MSKYGRITSELKDLPAEEPVFLLRGQDILAPIAIELYANLLRAAAVGAASVARSAGVGGKTVNDRIALLRDMAEQAGNVAATMIAWQAERGARLPD